MSVERLPSARSKSKSCRRHRTEPLITLHRVSCRKARAPARKRRTGTFESDSSRAIQGLSSLAAARTAFEFDVSAATPDDPQVVTESKVPAFLFLREDAQMDVMCAGPFDWLLEEWVDEVEGPAEREYSRVETGTPRACSMAQAWRRRLVCPMTGFAARPALGEPTCSMRKARLSSPRGRKSPRFRTAKARHDRMGNDLDHREQRDQFCTLYRRSGQGVAGACCPNDRSKSKSMPWH